MDRSEFGSIEVVRYSESSLINTLSELSSSTRHSVIKKDQTKFLKKYCADKKVSHIVVEGSYIDKSFIEDFSHYYVRCFQDYYKKCSRVHFFSFDKDGVDYTSFRRAISGNNVEVEGCSSDLTADDLQNSYLGFSVIRPIPKTIFGRTCLVPLDKYSNYLRKDYTVSFFGVDLVIESIAYQEQDKVVSACATSAIWSFLNAMPNVDPLGIPSPAKITKHAAESHHKSKRTFPNDGLTQEMMTDYLIKTGYEPIQFGLSSQYKQGKDIQTEAFSRFKEYVGAFIDSGLPLICMADFFVQSKIDQKYSFVAQHAFVITGYNLASEKSDSAEGFVSKAHMIDSVLVHDDRIGPYVPFKIKFCDTPFDIKPGSFGDTESVIEGECFYALEGSVEELKSDAHKNYLVIPNSLIMGVYHKIRIHYDIVSNSCSQFLKVVNEQIIGLNTDLEKDLAFSLSGCEWSIRLVENNKLKSYYRNQNISSDKISLLTESWPKYIWSARAINSDGEKLFDFLFDATDINQGDVFIRGVFWKDGWDDFLREVGFNTFKSISIMAEVDNENTAISGISKWFSDQLINKNVLDDLYGPPVLPSDVKPTEFPDYSVKPGVDVYPFDTPTQDCISSYIDVNEAYIWVVDAKGDLYVGRDVEDDDGDTTIILGHPTLIAGRRGRIGGEIRLSKDEAGQIVVSINNYSGRYSWDRATRGQRQLENAKELFDFIFKKNRNCFHIVDMKLNG